MNTKSERKMKPWLGWLVFFVTLGAVFLLGMLAASITERRAEITSIMYNKKVEIKGIESRSEKFEPNYPREYETWAQTVDTIFQSEFNGSSAKDVLAQRPEMVILWAGYAFSKEYTTPRGHMHAIEDLQHTLRVGSPMTPESGPQPATCWTCKGPDVPRMMDSLGVAAFYNNKWAAYGSEIVNPIGCADCHDPKTMALTITRPALIEAFTRQNKDIKQSTPQEMRTLACAQCHVEYYFTKDGNYLTFPWDKGISVEAIEQYYDNSNFSDWTHALSRAPMLKAQHPDYELFSLGPHAQRGLSCADCHMPYVSEGGIKYSNHQVMSPLKNIASTCQTCHRDSEEKLMNYVYEYQDKAIEIRTRLENELAKTHILAKLAWDKGANEKEMKGVLKLLRQAQWRWDFVVASHGSTFHAPVESQRILAHGLDKAMQAQLELQKVLFTYGVHNTNLPDISTKAKAQKYIGLDMDKLNKEKKDWINTTVPKWLEQAKKEGKLSKL